MRKITTTHDNRRHCSEHSIPGRILALDSSVSGISDYIFGGLRIRGWHVTRYLIPTTSTYNKLSTAVKTFSIAKKRWSHAYYQRLENYVKDLSMFQWRTAYCDKLITKHQDQIDVIFQMAVLFAPGIIGRFPYVTFNDFTMIQALNDCPMWVPRLRGEELEKWLTEERKVFSKASRVFVASDATNRAIVNDYGVNKERVVTVYEGAKEAIAGDRKNTNDSRTVLFVGNDFERKGGRILLKAFRLVKNTVPDARLLVVGPRTTDPGEPGVVWLGHVGDRDQLIRYYRQSSVFVMPSLCEPFGLVFLEAMSQGLPCVGTNIHAMPEIIAHGKTGFLISPGDHNDLANRIVELLTNSSLAKSMGDAGKNRVKHMFNWDAVVSSIDTHLRGIVGVDPRSEQSHNI